jgi:hypothetical protein
MNGPNLKIYLNFYCYRLDNGGENRPSENTALGKITESKREKIIRGEKQCILRRFVIGKDQQVFCFAMAKQPLLGQGLLIVEVSRSHSDTPHLLGLLWASDQPDVETSICQNSTHHKQPCPSRD